MNEYVCAVRDIGKSSGAFCFVIFFLLLGYSWFDCLIRLTVAYLFITFPICVPLRSLVCLFVRSVCDICSLNTFLICFVGHCVFMLKCQQNRKDCVYDRLLLSFAYMWEDYLFILLWLFIYFFLWNFIAFPVVFVLVFLCSLFKVIWILTSCFAKSANKIDKDLLVFYRENISFWNFHK